MNYVQVKITIQPYLEETAQILTALLSELPFESFEDTPEGLNAYIQEAAYNQKLTDEVITSIPFVKQEISYASSVIPKINWNAEWEKNFFDPILIDNKCLIRSSFHKNTPAVDYEILIDPKMSFGTGHHSTTTLMVKHILKMDFTGKAVLDMGCGTGILAILANMRGANPVMAIDIDEWCVENSTENITLNHTPDIQVKLGGAEAIGNYKFDVILANINRNILLQDMQVYKNALTPNGNLIMSGFYEIDLPMITEEAEKNGLKLQSFEVLKDWTAAVFN